MRQCGFNPKGTTVTRRRKQTAVDPTLPVKERREAIQEVLEEMEAEGLIEWTGEMRPGTDRTMLPVYRARPTLLLPTGGPTPPVPALH